jgi:TRAP-type C4-dicarboxylate transport system substrate-binding protein
VADPLVFVVNKDIWASWTPADREAVRQAAIEAGKEEIAMARKGLAEPGKPLLKDIAALGVTVTELTRRARRLRQGHRRSTTSGSRRWAPSW